LRNQNEVNTNCIGIRHLNLNHNSLGNQFAIEFAEQMGVCDHFMKCVTLRFNKIKKAGIEKLCVGVSGHKDYIGIDFRNNPGFCLERGIPDSKIFEVL